MRKIEVIGSKNTRLIIVALFSSILYSILAGNAYAVSIDSVVLNSTSGYNFTIDDLTAHAQGLDPADSNISYEWYKDGKVLPFEADGDHNWTSPGNYGDLIYSIVSDPSGNIYAGGYYNTAGTGTETGFGWRIMKFDPDFGFVRDYNWTSPGDYDDVINSIVSDPSGNIYAGGYYDSGGTGIDTGIDWRIVKLDPDLNIVKDYNWTSPGDFNDGILSIRIDPWGNIYAGGYFDSSGTGTNTGIDWRIVKLDPDLGFVSDYNWTSPGIFGDMIYSVETDPSGNIYAAGYYNTGGTTTNTGIDWRIVKLDPDLDFIRDYNWTSPGTFTDKIYSIESEHSGNIYAAGYHDTAGTGTDTGYGWRIVKLDNDLDLIKDYNWTSPGNYDDQPGFDPIEIDASGNIYAGGYYNTGGTTTNTGIDWRIVKLSPDLDFIRDYNWTSPGIFTDKVYSIESDHSGNIYAGGYYDAAGTGTDTGYGWRIVKLSEQTDQSLESSYTTVGEDWMVSATPVYDGVAGASVLSNELTIIEMSDLTDPAWEGNTTDLTSDSTIGDIVHFNITLNDANPDSYIFSWLNTTDWINDTPGQYSDGEEISVTKTVPADTGTVSWTWYVNDTFGNSVQTDVWSIVLRDSTDPSIDFTAPTTETGNTTQSWVSANVTASDNIGIDTIVLNLYNTSGLIRSNRSSSSPLFINFTDLPYGTYHINATVNDTSGNLDSTETRTISISEAIKLLNITLNIEINTYQHLNSTGEMTNMSIILKDGGEIIHEKVADQAYTVNIPEGVYDEFIFGAYDQEITATLRSVDIDSLTNATFGIDKHHEEAGYLATYGIDNGFSFANATVTIDYSGLDFTNENYLKLYHCADYVFMTRTCRGGWNDVTGSAQQDTDDDHFTYLTASFSGFGISEEIPDTAPSGGGRRSHSTVINDQAPEAILVNNTSVETPEVEMQSAEGTAPEAPREKAAEPERPDDMSEGFPEQLFDISFRIDDNMMQSSDDLSAVITFVSFGTVPTPVDLTYRILDISGKEVYNEKGTVTVTTEEVVRKSFNGLDLSDGEYSLVLSTLYGNDVADDFRQGFTISAGKKRSYTWIWIIGEIISVVYLIGLFRSGMWRVT